MDTMYLTPKKINFFNAFKLPVAFIAGVRVKSINSKSCVVVVKHKWINQNPFKSNLLVNELEWRPTFTFYATIFNYKSNPKLVKLPQKGRLKRKITKKVLLLNNILD
mgnify:CR=1 FL=1